MSMFATVSMNDILVPYAMVVVVEVVPNENLLQPQVSTGHVDRL